MISLRFTRERRGRLAAIQIGHIERLLRPGCVGSRSCLNALRAWHGHRGARNYSHCLQEATPADGAKQGGLFFIFHDGVNSITGYCQAQGYPGGDVKLLV